MLRKLRSGKNRILLILEHYHPHTGGVETLFRTLAEGLAKRGYIVDVITMRLPDYAPYEILKGVRIHRVRVPLHSRLLFPIVSLPLALRLAQDADIIHTTTYAAAPGAWLCARIRKKPVIITAHEILGAQWNTLPMHPLSAWAMRLLEAFSIRLPYDRIVTVSHASAEAVKKATTQDVTVVHNFIDTKHFAKRERSAELLQTYGIGTRPVLLAYGRPGVTKGFGHLIEALPAILATRGMDVLLIISKRPHSGYADVQRRIDRHNLRDRIIELNDIPYAQIPDYVNLADIVVVPSLTEGFGFTTVESATLGKIVVASDTGSIPEVIFGKHILVTPGDADAISEGVIRAFAQEYVTGKKKAFTPKKTIDGYEAVYASLRI